MHSTEKKCYVGLDLKKKYEEGSLARFQEQQQSMLTHKHMCAFQIIWKLVINGLSVDIPCD